MNQVPDRPDLDPDWLSPAEQVRRERERQQGEYDLYGDWQNDDR